MERDLRYDNYDDDLNQKNKAGVEYIIQIRKKLERTSLNI